MIWTLVLLALLWVGNILLSLLPVGSAFPSSVTLGFENAVQWLWAFDPIVDISLFITLVRTLILIIVAELAVAFIRFLFRPHHHPTDTHLK